MNGRQMVVLWIVTLTLSGFCVWQGLDVGDPFLYVAGPVALLGATLIYQLRDRNVVADQSTSGQGPGRALLLVVVAMEAAVLMHQHSLSTALEDVRSEVGQVESAVSDVEDSVNGLAVGLSAR